MRVFIITAAGALLSACTMAVSGAETRAGPRCAAEATSTWTATNSAAYTLEAFSAGPDCAHAVATIVIRDAESNVLWADAHVTEHTFGLNEASSAAEMRAALSEWISPYGNTTILSTSALPAWPRTADGPQSGEFPFYPEAEWNDREGYETLRARNAPVFCYVQGMESLACLALLDGGLYKVGVQSFPG